MNLLYRLIVLCCLTAQAVAQDGAPQRVTAPEQVDQSALREKRRMELRTALKAQQEAQKQNEPRQPFSEQERQVLRQQVSQQQNVGTSRP